MNVNVGTLKNNFSKKHKHDFYEFIVFTEGTGYLETDKENFSFSKGTIAIVPPNTLHHSTSKNDFERIFINGNFDRILNITNTVILQDGNENDGIILAKLIYNNRFNDTEYFSSLLNSFENYILGAIEIDDEMSMNIKKISNEITQNFNDTNLDVSEILKKSGYSEDYIRAQFKNKTGKTPIKFLTEIRIEHACVLIDMYKRSLSLTEIAENCGFTDYVYFSRRFKEIKGLSPREYIRKQTIKQVE